MRPTTRKFARWSTAFVVVTVATPIAAVAIIFASLIFLPLPTALPKPQPGLESRLSRVYDVAGNEVAVFREFETAIPVEQKDIPEILKQAVVVAEDRNFYRHGGVDIRSLGRAVWADLRAGKAVQGGSTITQQYARLAFVEVGTERTLARKIREAFIAAQLERSEDKEAILFGYLSRVYLGSGAFGVGAASETYFRKPVSQLTVSEAALLAGLIPAPTRYEPRRNPEIADQKRVLVLREMLNQGYIDQPTHDAALAEPVWLMANGEPSGPVTRVWPPVQQQSAHPWFTDYVRSYLETHLPGCSQNNCPLIYNGGLKIETTLDPRAQRYAEELVVSTMQGNAPELEMSITAVEPPTGYVRAIVGGRDWNVSQVNTALRKRQVGSAFKPFVLATAFEQGITPSRRYSGAPFKVGDHTIKNYGGASYGSLDLRTATWKSVNGVYGRLILDVGVDKTMETADKIGASMPPFDPGRFGASVALGAVEVSQVEMASAFGVFANHGRRAPPTPVLKVTDSSGKVLIDNTAVAEKAEQVVNEATADNVTDVLRGVLTSGTAAGKGIDRPAAGKTGTSQDYANASFVGFTPTLSTAVWMGRRDCGAGAVCNMGRVNGVRNVTGGAIPAPVWQKFMKFVLKDVPVTEFAEPAPIQTGKAKSDLRRGFAPGSRRSPEGTPTGGPYVYDTPSPEVESPTTSTSSTSTTRPGETTTTTRPFFFGPGPPDE